MNHTKRSALPAVILVIASVAVFYSLTIRPGHDWGGDFSLYIHHAQNMADGIAYGDTGFIYNPSVPFLSPQTYPPVYPMLLVPIYKLYGIDIRAMKIELLVIALLALLAVYLAMKDELSPRQVAAVVALTGFNSYFWEGKETVIALIPYIFFQYLALYLINEAYARMRGGLSSIHIGAAAGAAIYLTYGTRSIGIVLFAALISYDLLSNRRLTRVAVAASVCFILLAALQTLLLHSDSAYFDQFAALVRPSIFIENLIDYSILATSYWYNGYSIPLTLVLAVPLSLLALYGLVRKLREQVTVLEIFLIYYVATIIIYPTSGGIRYLTPLLPLYLFYIMYGIKNIGKKEGLVFAVSVALIAASYVSTYTTINFGPYGEGIAKRESVELFDAVKSNTKADDIFIFRKPRVLSLYTGRSAAIYHTPRETGDFWLYIDDIGATYVVSSFLDDNDFLRRFITAYRGSFELVLLNNSFSVYKIVGRED